MEITDTFSKCSVHFMSRAIYILQQRIKKLEGINKLLLAYGNDADTDTTKLFYNNSILIQNDKLSLDRATKILQDKVYSVPSSDEYKAYSDKEAYIDGYDIGYVDTNPNESNKSSDNRSPEQIKENSYLLYLM